MTTDKCEHLRPVAERMVAECRRMQGAGGTRFDIADALPYLAEVEAPLLATIEAQRKEIAALSSRCQVAIPGYAPRNATQTVAPSGAL